MITSRYVAAFLEICSVKEVSVSRPTLLVLVPYFVRFSNLFPSTSVFGPFMYSKYSEVLLVHKANDLCTEEVRDISLHPFRSLL